MCVCSGLRVQGQEVEEAPAKKYNRHGATKSKALLSLSFFSAFNEGNKVCRKPQLIATLRIKGAQCTHYEVMKPTYIHGRTQITRPKPGSKWHPSYLGQLVSKERPGMEFWGDYKTCWNHSECNCCFPIIKPDEDPQSICEQWSKKSNEEQEKHCQVVKGRRGGSAFNSQ